MLCILTRKRVLRTPFTGQNHCFQHLNKFPSQKGKKLEKAQKRKNTKRGLPAFRYYSQPLVDTLILVDTQMLVDLLENMHLNASRPPLSLFSYVFFFALFLAFSVCDVKRCWNACGAPHCWSKYTTWNHIFLPAWRCPVFHFETLVFTKLLGNLDYSFQHFIL